MKKILIINSQIPWGGIGQYTLNLTRSLNGKGYVVFGLITHHDDELFEDFKNLTKKTYYLGCHNKLYRYLKMINVIYQIKPDVIINNFNAPGHLVLPFLLKVVKISVIHSDQNDFYRISAINKSFTDCWISPSLKVKRGFSKFLNTLNFDSKNYLIPHGVQKSLNPLKTINMGTFNIVFVGALFEHKGVMILPEILCDIISDCPDIKFTIIGNGDLELLLKSKFSDCNLDSYIHFTGIISSNRVRQTLADMDVLLFPTRVESFGLVIAEAMMEGVVPIVSLLPNITDQMIIPEINGFLCNPNDPLSFSSVIKTLYFDREKLFLLSKNARQHSESLFSSSRMIDQYISLFENTSNEKIG